MANLKELRLRIASVKNTRKITAAMSQIASARLRRAQNATLAARPYGDRIEEVARQLVLGIDPARRAEAHPLLAERPVRRVLVLALSADRGLCGAFNSNVHRAVERELADRRAAKVDVRLITIGAKANGYFKGEHARIASHPAPTLATVVPLSKAVAAEARAAFLHADERVDQVTLYYNHFVSVLAQKVTPLPLLPYEATAEERAWNEAPVFEPSREHLLAHLLPVAVESRLQQAMFNSIAAEIAARRVAMDAATDNASEMIADLTLQFNRERQAAITTELMEIIGGAEALKGG